MKHYKIIIIGGGSAGMGAAIKANDEGISSKDILILEKSEYLGGILNQCIHTGFGLAEFKEELTGPEYAYRFIIQVKERNIPYLLSTMVISINLDKTIEIRSVNGDEMLSYDALIIATGCIERSPGAIKLNGDRCSGIMTAGQAQNYLNNYGYLPGKKVFILGSGDIGLIMARRMTLEGAKVIGVAELMPYSNGLKRNIVQCLEDYDIPLYLSTTVKETIGKNRLEKIILASVDDKLNFISGTEKEIECDTLLLSVGLIPNVNMLSKLNLKKDKTGKFLINEKCETSMEGIYICGNSLHVHDLVDEVTKESRIAGYFAAKYVLEGENHDEYTPVTHNENVGYVVPNVLNKNYRGNVSIKFRCRKPIKDITVIIKDASKTYKSIKKLALIPSEMQNITFNIENEIDSFLTVEIV